MIASTLRDLMGKVLKVLYRTAATWHRVIPDQVEAALRPWHRGMVMELAAPKPGWSPLLREHARLHAPAALGLGLALLAVLALLVHSLMQLAGGNAARGGCVSPSSAWRRDSRQRRWARCRRWYCADCRSAWGTACSD